MSAMWQAHIDWVTLTLVGAPDGILDECGNLDDAQLAAALVVEQLNIGSPDHLVRVRPDFGYAYGFAHSSTGVVVSVGFRLSKQGLKVVASGKALHRLSNGTEFLRQSIALGWKPTRVDIAFDLFESGLNIPHLAIQLNNPDAPGARYKRTFVQSRTGCTLSLGGRSSMKYLRIYDKAAEQGNPGDWKRVELELKGDYLAENADVYARDLLAASYDIDAMIGGLSPEIDSVLYEAQGREMPSRVEGKLEPDSSKLLWLEKSVLPSIAEMYRTNRPDYEKFMHMLADQTTGNDFRAMFVGGLD